MMGSFPEGEAQNDNDKTRRKAAFSAPYFIIVFLHRHPKRLLSQAKLLDDGLIPAYFGSLEVIEEFSPAGNHMKQSSSGMVVLFMDIKVIH